jgi:hypothetical protein
VSIGGIISLILSRNIPIIRDKLLGKEMEQHIADKLVSMIYGIGRGKVLTPKNFLDLASHETAWQALSPLAKEGKIRRLLRVVSCECVTLC